MEHLNILIHVLILFQCAVLLMALIIGVLPINIIVVLGVEMQFALIHWKSAVMDINSIHIVQPPHIIVVQDVVKLLVCIQLNIAVGRMACISISALLTIDIVLKRYWHIYKKEAITNLRLYNKMMMKVQFYVLIIMIINIIYLNWFILFFF